MKIFFYFISIVLTTFALSCNSSRKVITDFGWNKDCPFNRLNFTETSEEYDIKKAISVTDSLITGLSKDTESIKLKGKVENKLDATINNIVKKTGKGEVKVSTEWFQEYTYFSNTICTLREDLKDGLIKSEDAKKRVQNLYLDFYESLINRKKDLEKKSNNKLH